MVILILYPLIYELETATHPSILDWRIPLSEEPGGLFIVYGVVGI